MMNNNKQRIVSYPGPNDVLFAKGTKAFYHVGNCQFRDLVEAQAPSYAEAGNNKMLKTQIVNSIIQSIYAAGGCFLSRIVLNGNQELFEKTKMKTTKEKVGHALRRAVADRKSTTSSREYPQLNTEQSLSSTQKSASPNLQLQHKLEPQIQQQFGTVSNSECVSSLYEPCSIESYSQQECESIDVQSARFIQESLKEPAGVDCSSDGEIKSVFADWIEK